MTYVALANITLGSSASSVTFSSIPATFRDLIVVGSIRGSAEMFLLSTVNSDSGANYSRVVMAGNGSTTTSFANTSQGSLDFGSIISGTNFSAVLLQFLDYSATDKHKTVLTRINTADVSANQPIAAGAFRWANTASINTIRLSGTSNFAAGSTFALYGIAA